jgi:hypothetical protein
MREPSAPAHLEGAADRTAVAPAALLKALSHAIDGELGSLREGVAPLLDEVGQGLAALSPEPGAERLPPKQQEAAREKLAKTLDEMEDVLEALQLAAHPRGQAGGVGSRGGS